MQASEITFGCEFEVYLPAGTVEAGGYHSGRQVDGLAIGWNAQRDGSLNQPPAGYVGVEIVSPVLQGKDGLDQVVKACEWLRSKAAKVNKTCGFHVHVGVPRGNENLLSAIAHSVANLEKAIYATTGTKTRERGHYAAPISNDAAYISRFCRGQRNSTDRYRLLNLQNIDRGGKPTVEFRAFGGTAGNVTKVLGYIRLCVSIVERASELARKAQWTAKKTKETSPIHRGGEGQTALARFFYRMGWTKGQAKKEYGVIDETSATSTHSIKTELMRLAKKYDAEQ